MVIGFPVRFMREYVGRETCYVFATEFEAGDHRCRFLPSTPVITMPKAKVAFSWYACVDGRLESFVSSFWREDHVGKIIQKYGYTDYTGADAPKVQEDKECCDRLSVLMFKLLVVLNTRPNLIEPATCIRRACKKKGKLRTELWSPNVIGAKYRADRDTRQSPPTLASRSSPQPAARTGPDAPPTHLDRADVGRDAGTTFMRTTSSEYRQSLACQLGPAAGPAAGHSMRLDLLKRLLAVPSYSRQEGRMVEFLVEHVRQRGKERCGEIVTDECNNVFIRKGGPGVVPCVAAHIDTVHPLRSVKIVERDGVLVGFDEHGQRTGIGGDDKVGVFVCLELLEHFDHIAVALFAAEEIACVGAKLAPAAWFEDVGCVVEFDCPGRGLVSYTSNGTRLFANGGEFIQTAAPVLQAHGLTHWQHHPYSDVMALRQRFGFSCLNLSCGYRNWHCSDEHVVIEEVEAAINAGKALISTLGCRAYPFAGEAEDAAAPMFAVTDLQLL